MSNQIIPITKEAAAEILGVSLRTIDNYIHDKQMPAPANIGRRVYWHPDEFYSWLDAALRQKSNNNSSETVSERSTQDNAMVAVTGSISVSAPKPKVSRPAKMSNQSTGSNALRIAASRDEALLKKMATGEESGTC